MNVQGHLAQAPSYLVGMPPHVEGTSVQDVVLKHLKTHAEIATILDLRGEIDLSVHAAAAQEQFAMLEKKETS